MSVFERPTQRWQEDPSGLVTPLGQHRPPGLVVIPVAENLRHTDFFSSFTQLRIPKGSMTGVAKSASITGNLNRSIQQLKPHHRWVFILGDDHIFPPTLLEQLIDLQVDVAVPLCVRRAPPFELVCYREQVEDLDGSPGYLAYMPHEIPEHPFPVLAAGSAGMLISRRVIDALDYPYFENSHGAASNEDLHFCRKVRDAGFEIVCHPKAMLGHIGQMHVWPVWKDGRLALMVDCGGPPGYNEVLIEDPAP